MSETDEQFVERISREVYPGFDGWRTVSMMDHSLDRLITLARRGAAVQDGMVVVPRKPTQAMLHCGEGITDFTLPDGFENNKAARMLEMQCAWYAMIEQWEREKALPPPPAGETSDE